MFRDDREGAHEHGRYFSNRGTRELGCGTTAPRRQAYSDQDCRVPHAASRRRRVRGGPVSTTHVLSSGVAGTMAANRSGLQWTTIRNLLMAWILTLPMAILLSGGLYWLFSQLF
jgi:hypothetical protein